jgi:hypothetical protein
MKTLRLSPLLILLTCLLIACNAADQLTEMPPITPGDTLGDMAIVTAGYPMPHVSEFCAEEELLSGDCQVPSDIGHIAITNGWEEDTGAALEATWSDSTWELEIDGRKVDLPAFGIPFWDSDEPTLRVWNVALRSPAPGEHTVHWSYDIAGQCIEETWIFTVDEGLQSTINQ